MKVNVLFCWPEDKRSTAKTWKERLSAWLWFVIGKVIDKAEGAGDDPTHVGIFMLDALLEATPDGFVKSPVDIYKDRKTRTITVDVPNIGDAELEAKRLRNTPYGWIDCVNGGLHDITGCQLPGDGEVTVNCSEAVTRILRAGGLDIMQGVYADGVTPADLMRALEVVTV
ncbi:MAG: hypothetical protein H6Q73_4066 [Firmicutes bacterium]|nr:hypothetical protein [Bacillota bacterium]